MKKIKIISLAIFCFVSLHSNAFAQNEIDEIKSIDKMSDGTEYQVSNHDSSEYQVSEDNSPKYSSYASKNFTSRKYVLGPNDVLGITVYNAQEFNQNNVRVHPDGRIIVTPLGSMMVAGLSIDELYKLLNVKYSYYLVNPEISINLVESRPSIIYVTGAVLNPGSYELDTNTTKTENLRTIKSEVAITRKTPLLSNILVAAGGLSYDADLEHIQISNSLDKSKYEVNLLQMLDKGDSSQDIYLMGGDTVYIPRLPTPLAVKEETYRKFAGATFSPSSVPVKVFGYVNNPGLVRLDPAQSLNLNSAITAAGGYLHDSAYAPKQVFVSRVDVSGKLVTRTINPMSNDMMLMPNDIVYVPEKVRPLAGKAFDYASRVLNPVSNVADSYNNWALIFNPKRYNVVGY